MPKKTYTMRTPVFAVSYETFDVQWPEETRTLETGGDESLEAIHLQLDGIQREMQTLKERADKIVLECKQKGR